MSLLDFIPEHRTYFIPFCDKDIDMDRSLLPDETLMEDEALEKYVHHIVMNTAIELADKLNIKEGKQFYLLIIF